MTTTINNEHKKLNVPNLRFPEFQGEWKRTIFKNVITLQRGSSPRPIIEYVTTSDDGVNWIKIGDMPHFGRIVTSTEEKITKEGAKKSRQVNKGDLILSNSMSYGLPYIMGIDGYIHDGWFVLKNFENTFDKDYLCNLLISSAIQNQYKRLAAGGVVQNISSDLVNSVSVSIPTMMEQKKISSLLNLIDERIATQNKIIDKLKSLIKGIDEVVFQSCSKHCKLKEFDNQITAGRDKVEEGCFPLYGSTGVIGTTATPSYHEPLVLVARVGSIGCVQFVNIPCGVSDNTIVIRCGSKAKYVYYYLQNYNFERITSGTTQPLITAKDVKHIDIPIIDSANDLKAINTLDTLNMKLELESNLYNTILKQKAFLLQQMFI